MLFANFAEAMAEGRGKAQADTLRKAKGETIAYRYRPDGSHRSRLQRRSSASGDVIRVEAGQFIAGDGEVIEGVASVDESAITGESAPVIREAGGDRSAVTGGTRVLSDWIKIRITSNPGETFLDRMIALVEGAKRQKTPNEIALSILLAGLTIIFLLAVRHAAALRHLLRTRRRPIFVLVSLLVCLIPTTIGGLLSAIGIAGMDRLVQYNVLAMSRPRRRGRRRRQHAAARQDRHHHPRQSPGHGVHPRARRQHRAPGRRRPALLARRRNARRPLHRRARQGEIQPARPRPHAACTPSSSPSPRRPACRGVDLPGTQDPQRLRRRHRALRRAARLHACPARSRDRVEEIARLGGTPLVVAENSTALGVVYLKDIVKGGLKERLARLRAMGIRTIMITGDNPLTAAAIAREAGVDDFLAEAKPKDKMDLIKREQGKGKLVAMTGDGTNDAPALAQADVGVAMNTGTQAAKEAGNMVDLDSNPTKLIEIVEIGKQLLMTRGALTTFSIANDVAKYFAIIPAMFAGVFPVLERAQRHAPGHAALGHSLRGHLQRAHHRRAHPAGAARREVRAHVARRRCCGATCSSTASAASSCPSSASSSSTWPSTACTWPEQAAMSSYLERQP